MSNDTHLIWIDLETTGLAPGCLVLEIAVIVTGPDLDPQADPLGMTVCLPAGVEMEPAARAMHTNSGLLDELQFGWEQDLSPLPPWDCDDEQAAEDYVLSYLTGMGIEPSTAPLAGNSVHFDRRVLADRMPRLHDFLHRRNVDVSSLLELAARWRPDLYEIAMSARRGFHRAMPDLEESIAILRMFRREWLT